MKDLLIYLAQNLVTKPDQVTVDEIEKDEEILFEVMLDSPADTIMKQYDVPKRQ